MAGRTGDWSEWVTMVDMTICSIEISGVTLATEVLAGDSAPGLDAPRVQECCSEH